MQSAIIYSHCVFTFFHWFFIVFQDFHWNFRFFSFIFWSTIRKEIINEIILQKFTVNSFHDEKIYFKIALKYNSTENNVFQYFFQFESIINMQYEFKETNKTNLIQNNLIDIDC